MIRKKPTTINIMFHKGLIITVAAFIAASPAAYAKPTTPNVGGRWKSLASLPPGLMKKSVGTLPKPLQVKALAALNNMHISAGDDTYRADKRGDIFVVEKPADGSNDHGKPNRERRLLFSGQPATTFDSFNVPIHHSKEGAGSAIYIHVQGGAISSDTAWGSYTTSAYKRTIAGPVTFTVRA